MLSPVLERAIAALPAVAPAPGQAFEQRDDQFTLRRERFTIAVASSAPELQVQRTDSRTSISLRPVARPFDVGAGLLHEGTTVYPGSSAAVVLTPRRDGIKEHFVLTEPIGARLTFEWELSVEGALEPRLDAEGNVNIQRPSGEKLYIIPAPVIYTATGTAPRSAAHFELDKTRLRLVADGLFGLSYPLSIDPSVIVTSSADFNLAGNNEGAIDITATELARQKHNVGVGTWAATAAFTTARERHASVAHNGFMYVLGGTNGAYLSDVQYAAINANGTTGAYASTTALPTGRAGHSSVAYNGYLYVIGGTNGGYLNTVHAARINADGTLGTWTAATPFPTARAGHASIAYNGHLYVIGGFDGTTRRNDVQRAPLNGDGTVGAWSSAGSFTTGRELHASVAYHGYLYIFGGYSGSTRLNDVQLAKLNSDGSLSAFTTTSAFTTGRQGHAGVVHNGYLYVTGGFTGAGRLNDVQIAPVQANGRLGAWRATGTFTTARDGHAGVGYKGHLYVLGGFDGAARLATVQVAPLNASGQIHSWGTTTPLPNGLYRHGGVAYNGYMYVLGGTGSPSVARYAPINANGTLGAWTNTTPLGANITLPGVAAYNNHLYVVGGHDGSHRNEVMFAAINPNGSLGAWTQTSTLITARRDFTALVHNGYLYALGGNTTGGNVINSVEYAKINADGTVGAWANTTAFAEPRDQIGVAAYNGYLYVIGGFTDVGSGDTANTQYAPFNANGTVGTWTNTTPLPMSQDLANTVSAYNGYIYTVGGFDEDTGVSLNTVQTAPINSNGTLGAWQALPPMSHAADWAVSVIYNGVLYNLGGDLGPTDTTQVSMAYIRDGAKGTVDTWATTTAFPTARAGHASVAHDGHLYVVGGNGGTFRNDVQEAPINSDGTIATWTARSSFTTARSNHASLISNGYLYVLGGYDGTTRRNDVQFAAVNADGSLGTFSATAAFPTGRERHAATAYNGYVYVVGGYDGTTRRNDVRFAPLNADGTVGAWAATSAFTTGREAHSALAYNGYLYVIGGYDGGTRLSSVEAAPINANGTLGAFANVAFMTVPRENPAALGQDGFIYVFGGTNGAYQHSVESAPVNASGRLGNWHFTSAFGTARSGHSTAVHEGFVYVLGGTNGTVRNDVQVAALGAPAAKGYYSKLVDLGAVSSVDTVTLNGAATKQGAVSLEYRVAPASGAFGPTIAKGEVTLGNAITLNEVGARYLWMRLLLNDSAAAIVSPDGTAERDVSDFTVVYTVGPPATQLAFTTPPRTFTAGGCGGAGNVIRVELRDATSAPALAGAGGVAITASSSSTGTVTWFTDTTCTTTAGGGAFTIASGSSTVDLYYRDTRAGSPTVTLTNGAGLSNPTGQIHTVLPGAATKLALTVQPTSAQAGATLAPALQVTVQDANNNTVTSSSASIAMAIGANPGTSTLSGTTPVSAVNGVATFANLSLNKTGTGYSLVASSAGLTSATSSAFNITPGAATKLAFTVQPTSAEAGASLAPAVQVTVQDANNNTVTSSTASIAMGIGANPGASTLFGTTPVAAVNGVATFANLSLNKTGTGYSLVASSAGLTSATSNAFNVSPGAATKLAFTVQPSSAQAGASIAPAVQVTVQDANNNTVTGSSAPIAIAIGANPGGSALSGTTPVGAVNGVATFANLSLNRVGTGYTVVASSAGLTGATSSPFNITVGAANRLAFTVQPSSAAAGASLAPAIQVTVQDSSGNTVTNSAASISLGLGANPGGSTLSGTTPVSAVNGVATFANLSLNKTGTGYTLVASSAGLTGATSNPFNIVPGAAARLVFSVQPTHAQAGATLAPALQVRVEDANGNTATGSSATVTLGLSSNPGGSTLSGTTSAAAVAGIATFSTLSLNRTGTGYTLAASSTGLSGATSNPFNITPGAATRVAFVTQPSNVLAGAAISPAVQLAVQDAHGNTVTSSSALVTVSLGNNPGGAELSGTPSATASAGIATFSTLRLDAASAGYTLSAASAGLTGATSASFDVLPASATRLVYSVQPTATVAGAAVAPAVRVEVQDNLGNLVTSSTAPVTVALNANPGASTLGGTLTVNAVAGVATFSNLSLNRTGTGYTLAASSPGFIGAVSNAFNITPGAAAALAFTVQPPDGTAGSALAPAVQVTVLDSNGNTVTGSAASVTVSLDDNPGAATLAGTLTVAAASGVATFSTLSLNRPGNGYTLLATAGALTQTTSASFDIAPGAANRVAFSVQPSGAAAGTAMAPAITVLVQDSFGNRITSSSANVTLAIGTNPSGGTLSGTLTVAATAGVATFSNLSLNVAGTGYTLVATSAGLASATSAAFNISAGGASRLAFSVQPTNAVAGAALSPAVQVRIEDANGNLVTSSSLGVTLALAANPSGGTLSGAQVQSAVSGVATFPGISINRAGAGYSLSASSTGLTGATSTTFSITVGAAARVAFAVQPPDGAAGTALTPAFNVEVRDASGNVVTSSSATVTVALGNNPGGAALTGTLSTATASGVAGFGNVRLNRPGTGYTLVASAPGLASDTSIGFSISAGAAASLAFSGPPSDTTAGAVMAPAVEVSIHDSAGNLVTGSAAPVTLQLGANPGGALLGGTLTVNAVNGRASFSTLTLNRAASGYTLSASAPSLTSALSAPFEVVGAAASRVAISSPPRTALAGVCSSVVNVEVQDAMGNPATLAAALPLSLDLPGVQLFGDSSCGTPLGAVGFGPGAPQVSVHFRGTLAGTYNLSASAAALPADTQPQTVTAGPAVRLDARGFPSPIGAGQMGQLTVTARDAYGNRVRDFVGMLAVTASDPLAQLPAPVSMSAADQGEVIVPVSLRTLGAHSLGGSSGALSGSQAGIVVSPGPVHHFVLSGIPSPTLIERWLNLSVVAEDQFNNVAVNHVGTVRFSSSDGAAVLQPGFAFTSAHQGSVSLPGALRFRTAGTHEVTVVDASNPLVFGAQTGIVVNGNSPPLITTNANRRAAVGIPYRYNAFGRVEALGALPMAYSACGGPAGFQVDPQTGTVSWLPTEEGLASLCVKAVNTAGEDSYTFEVNVSVRVPTPVVAAFTAAPAAGGAPLDVVLDATSSQAAATAMPMMFQWSHGDGSPLSSGSTSTHRYTLPGGYLVRLAAFDSFGARDDAFSFVRVSNASGAVPPTARIQASATSGRDSLQVDFTCDCEGGGAPIVAYRWDLLTAPPQTGSTATAVFGPGAYEVRLTVVDSAGLSATDTVLISVSRGELPPPHCRASVDPPAGEAPVTVLWTGEALAIGGAIARQGWILEEGQVDGAIIRRTYSQPGSHGGRFVVEDTHGLLCQSEVWSTASSAGRMPPRILSLPLGTASCGTPYTHAPAAVGDAPLSWSLSVAPEGMSVDEATGELRWTPTRGQTGPNPVTLIASGGGGAFEQSLVIESTCEEANLRVGLGCSSGSAAPSCLLSLLWIAGLWRARRRP